MTSPSYLQNVIVKISGLKPGLLCDNGQNADPSSSNAVHLSRLRDQAKSSDSARKEYAQAQLIARSYFNEAGELTIPTNMVQASWSAGVSKSGAKTKDIKKFQSAFTVLNVDFFIDGKRGVQEDLEKNAFSAIVSNSGGGGKSLIYRPHFKNWSADILVEIETDIIDKRILENIVSAAGRFVGFGSWRPSAKKPGKFGRFQLTEIVDAE